MGQAHYSWPLNFHTNASFSYVLPVSNMISKGYKSSKSEVGQKLIYPLIYCKINIEGNQTSCCTIGIIPQESDCWSDNMMNVSMKCQSHFITLSHSFAQLFEGSLSFRCICCFDNHTNIWGLLFPLLLEIALMHTVN